jgi:hypothetical protein
VVGIAAEPVNVPPSILYSTLNPVTKVTVGNVNADAQVLAGVASAGASGNITTLTVFDKQVLGVPAAVPPQAAARRYLA